MSQTQGRRCVSDIHDGRRWEEEVKLEDVRLEDVELVPEDVLLHVSLIGGVNDPAPPEPTAFVS